MDDPLAGPFPCQRGGQPGNQNARKHGFYSASLSQGEQQALSEARDLKDLQPEIAFMRVKLMEPCSSPNASDDPIIKAVQALTRMIDVQHKVTFH